MKVLFIITKGNNIGGAQIYVRDLACKMLKSGIEVHVAMGSKGELGFQLEQAGVKTIYLDNLVVPINLIKDIRGVIEICQLIDKIKPDIVSLNSSKVGIIGRLACWYKKIPNIFVVHGWSFTPGVGFIKIQLYKSIEKLLKPFSKYWICVSQFDYEYGLKNRVIAKDKTMQIHNGVSIREPYQQKSLFNYNHIQAVMIARHDYQKDHLTLFKALVELNNITVTLIGDGPLLENNKELAMKMGLSQKVVFAEYQKDVSIFLKQANLFLLISNWEGFPISTLEAMSYSLPIIVSRVGGAAEAITNGSEGYTIEHKNYKQIIQVIKSLQENKDLIPMLSQNSYYRCSDLFSFDITYKKTIDFFLKVSLK